jgi:hypothetical protein
MTTVSDRVAGTLPLPEVPEKRVEAAEAELRRLRKLSRDLYAQYIEAQPKRGAAMVARDQLAALAVPPEEMEHVQAIADQLPRLRALVDQGLRGHQDAERQIEGLLVRELESFVVAAERHVTEVQRIAEEELAPVLAKYDAAWRKAADVYGGLEKALVASIAARDESAQVWRDVATLRAEAQLPARPLPSDAMSLVREVLPRPRIFRD